MQLPVCSICSGLFDLGLESSLVCLLSLDFWVAEHEISFLGGSMRKRGWIYLKVGLTTMNSTSV